jgi:hypothetical protein
LCKQADWILCDFSRYLLDMLMWPVRALFGKVMDVLMGATGIVPPPPGVETIHRWFDFLVFGIAISLHLLYWFLLGGTVCKLWRSARSRIQNAFGETRALS